MKEVKVSELQGAALDWAVAQVNIQSGEFTTDSEEHGTGRPYFNCNNGEPCLWGSGVQAIGTMNAKTGNPWVMHGSGGDYSPSIDWSQGGPLIDKYRIDVNWLSLDVCAEFSDTDDLGMEGKCVLVAVCRAIVYYKLGEVVQIPDELVS